MIELCPKCRSNYIYFSKRHNCFICEDCGEKFLDSELKKKIFFSYGHDKNAVIVERLLNDLKDTYDVWIDKNEIKTGDDWRIKITNGILESDYVISFLSMHSVRIPGVCLDELKIAICEKYGNIITVLLENEKDVSIPSSISHIQWLDMSQWEINTAGNDNWYDEKKNELIRVLNEPHKVNFVGDISKIYDIIKPITNDTKEQFLLNKKFYGRKWLLNMIDEWLGTSSKLFVIYGGPGFGKSSFITHMAHYYNNVICSLFCEADKEFHNNTKNLIKIMAFKIASKMHDFRIGLLRKLDIIKHINLNDFSANELFEKLIIEPFNEMIDGNRETKLIFIDGLDETERENGSEISSILANNIHKLPSWIKVVITSRPSLNIKQLFKSYNPLEINSENDENVNDIYNYLNDELNYLVSKDVNYHDNLKIATRKCNGSFLYASLLIDCIKNSSINIADPQLFPSGLEQFYMVNFNRYFSDYKKFIRLKPVLELLIANSSIPCALIERITKLSRYDLNELNYLMGSFIYEINIKVGKYKMLIPVYEISHKSIADWLTDPHKSGKYFIDVEQGHLNLLSYMLENIKDYYVREDTILNVSQYIDYYIQENIIDLFCKLEKYDEMKSFLEKDSTPLYPYWKALSRFPKEKDISDLYEKLWLNKDKNFFFNQLQFYGESRLISSILEVFKNKYGIKEFDSDLFETYVDIVHLSGNYVMAVELYEEYLSNHTEEEIYNSEIYLHYYIRMLHHSMFFKPVKGLLTKAEEIIVRKNIMLSSKDYAELLFLIGGNLGVLSGEHETAYKWLKKCEEFCIENNMQDNLLRVHRKLADVMAHNGQIEEAIDLVEKHVDLTSNIKNRYQIYLLASLGETYRQKKEYSKAYKIFDKLEIMTQEKGLSSWVSHIFLCKALLMTEIGVDINEITNYLSKANSQYNQAKHIWGIINSTIVKFLLYQSNNIKMEQEELLEILEMSKKYEYKYETNVLEKILKSENVENFRLFLL